MAYQDQFYTVGTASVTNGSPSVTGSGTGWETALISGGVFYAGGGAYPILTVENETSLTLAIPYTGATGSGLSYAIDRQRAAAISNIAMNDRLAQIIREINVGNIEEINGLENIDNLIEFAALQLAARQILQTDQNGALKAIALAANKALVTDANKDVQQIDLGTLGRALLALATGTNAQYVQGDGTLQAKAALPVSTPMQTALNDKLSKTTDDFIDSSKNFRGPASRLRFANGEYSNAFEIFGNLGAGNTNFGLVIQRTVGGPIMTIGSGNSYDVAVSGTLSKGGGTALFDHPLDPLNKNLRYGFTEGPRYYLVHVGAAQLVNGHATVDLDAEFGTSPGTFAAATQKAFVTGLNHQGSTDPVCNSPIEDGIFEITDPKGGSGLVVWTVIAERGDAFVRNLDPNCERGTGRFIPEFDKPDYVEADNG